MNQHITRVANGLDRTAEPLSPSRTLHTAPARTHQVSPTAEGIRTLPRTPHRHAATPGTLAPMGPLHASSHFHTI